MRKSVLGNELLHRLAIATGADTDIWVGVLLLNSVRRLRKFFKGTWCTMVSCRHYSQYPRSDRNRFTDLSWS